MFHHFECPEMSGKFHEVISVAGFCVGKYAATIWKVQFCVQSQSIWCSSLEPQRNELDISSAKGFNIRPVLNVFGDWLIGIVGPDGRVEGFHRRRCKDIIN